MSATVAWPVFQSARVSREQVAERTMSFRFAKPADWSYRAGTSPCSIHPRPMPRETPAASPSRAHHVRA